MSGSNLDAFADSMRQVLDRCVWTQGQTHESLVPYLIEESYELVDAIESGSREDVLEELGDVLWQVAFHAELASRTPGEGFDLQDVAARVNEKMVRRHPHVFGDETAETPEDVLRLWNAAKAAEKKERTSVLDGIPPQLPALALADKVIGRAARVGVEVPVPEGDESPDASPEAPPADEAALGALLLGVVAGAHARGLDAERALRSAVRSLSTEVRAAEAAPSAHQGF